MSDRVEDYRAYARFVRRLLLFGGIWPGSKEQGILYKHVVVLAILSGLLMLCGIGTFGWQNVTNVSVLTKSSSLFASFLAVVLKACLFSVYRRDLREVNGILDTLFEESLDKPRCRTALLSLLRFFHRPSHVLTLSTLFIMLLYLLKPMLSLLRQSNSGTKLKLNVLSFPAIYPWQIGDSMILYQLHYFFELQFSWFVLCITSGVDTLFGFYMFQMSALLRAMGSEIADVGPEGERESVLRSCVDRHTSLMRCRDIVQRVYGPIVLLMALTNALIMCSLVFQAFQLAGMSIDKALLFVFYIFMKMSQTFMYAWYGHIVTSESEKFRREVYLTRWYEGSDNVFAKNVLLVMMQRPITLTACKFFRISLDFFLRIINTTISYFFLLQTLDDDEQ